MISRLFEFRIFRCEDCGERIPRGYLPRVSGEGEVFGFNCDWDSVAKKRERERKGVKRHNVLKELKESVFKLWDG